MAAIGNSTMSLRRQIKNVVSNYSDAQVKVREATSNDPWGPSSSLMSEIADMTYNAMAFTEIMQMIWKRLNDHGKNWRHVYKSLVVLDYLIKVGSEKVAQQCRENIFAIQTLKVIKQDKDFQHVDDNKDQGMNVREKAKQLVALLKDEERLKNERTKALMAKKRFSQNGVGIGSDGTTSHVRRSDTYHGGGAEEAGMAIGGRTRRSSEFDECRPSSIGEEELQLQIALALSREEAEKEADQRKSDDVRLQMALNESKTSDVSSSSIGAATASASRTNNANAIDDLLSLQMPSNTVAAASSSAYGGSDPWASSPRHVAGAPAPQYDPWGAPIQNHADAWSEPPPYVVPTIVPAVSVKNDPWSAPPNNFNQPLVNDPWSSNMNDPFNTNSNKLPDFIGSSMNDPFAVNSSPYDLNNHQQRRIDELDAFLSSNSNDDGAKFHQMKTPETFLGENSSLVNLDNLMGPSKPLVSGLPPPAVKANPSVPNPFAAGGGASTNPFLIQQRPSPTLNQMKSSGAIVSPGGWSSATTTPRGASAAPNAWNLPQPMQPMEPRPASTNPFLS